jgi:hypothetical protein
MLFGLRFKGQRFKVQWLLSFDLILRYYSCFFNSLGCAIALVFFSSSGKNTDQNQDPSSFEALAPPPVRQLGLSRYFSDFTPCRPDGSTPEITTLFLREP